MYKFVWIIVISLIVFTGYKFAADFEGPHTSMDEYKVALKETLPFIKPGSRVNFSGTKDQVEGLIQSRYVLFPMRIDRMLDFDRDTSLLIFDLNTQDSVKSTYLENKTIFWQYRDGNREYLLAARGKGN